MNSITSHDNFQEFLTQLGDLHKFDSTFLEKRKIFLWGAVTYESAKYITNRLLFLDNLNPGKEITLYINSPGGVVTSGMVIHDTMKLISSPVATVCMGLAASMGSILLAAGAKGKRYIWPHGRVMIHQPSMGGLYGQASDIQIHAKEIARTKEFSAQLLAEYCHKEQADIMHDFDRDYWMNAQESLSYGIVDKIADKITL